MSPVVLWSTLAVLGATPTTRVDLSSTACPGLDDAEVTRLLMLEITGLLATAPTGTVVAVEVRCDERLGITVAANRHSLVRQFAKAVDQPGRERVVALAVAQVISAGWPELSQPPTELDVVGAAPVEPPAEVQPPPPAWASHEVAVRGGAAAAGSWSASAALCARWWPTERLAVMARAALGWADVHRALGDVALRRGDFLVGASWQLARVGWFEFEAGVLGGPSYAVLAGSSSDRAVQLGQVPAFGGSASAVLAAALVRAWLVVRLEAEVGLALPKLRGLVSDAAPVIWGGLVVQSSAAVGVRW